MNQIVLGNAANWLVGTNSEPEFDHTSGQYTGGFAYLDSSKMVGGTVASLQSLVFGGDSDNCFMRYSLLDYFVLYCCFITRRTA